MTVEITRVGDEIYINHPDPNCRVIRTTFTSDLLSQLLTVKSWSIQYKVKKSKINGQQVEEKKPQYLKAGAKYFHRLVMEYLLTPDAVKDAYSKGMIIEHLNNDGFDCCFSNLQFLLKRRNIAKALTFDNDQPKAIKNAAINMFYNYEKGNYQITMVFNVFMQNSRTGEYLQSIKLLYRTNDYWVVVQDAERLANKLASDQPVVLAELLTNLRCAEIRCNTQPQIELTEEEQQLPAGSVVRRGDEVYFIRRNDDNGYFQLLSTPYDKDWD